MRVVHAGWVRNSKTCEIGFGFMAHSPPPLWGRHGAGAPCHAVSLASVPIDRNRLEIVAGGGARADDRRLAVADALQLAEAIRGTVFGDACEQAAGRLRIEDQLVALVRRDRHGVPDGAPQSE